MANNKKFVVKNGLTTSNIEFKDDINNGTNTITMSMLSTDVLSFSGDSGQLFSISDSLTGTIFSLNDISGIASVEVDDDGTIRLAEFAGNILVGSNTDNGSDKLQVTGNTIVDGTIKATDFTIGTSGKLTSNNYLQGQLGAKLNSSSYTASDVLTKIKTVDGSGSGLDADTLDGIHASGLTSNNYVQTYVASEIAGLVDSAPTTLDTLNELAAALGDDANFSTTVTNSLATKASNNYLQSQLSTKLNSSSYTASDVLTKIKTVDGSGSGLDADLLDGAQPSVAASNDTIVKRHSSGYIFANFFNTTPNDVSSGVTKVLVETGNDGFMRHGTQAAIRTFIGAGSGNGLDADLLDGLHASGLVSNNYFQDNSGGGATGGGSDKIFHNNDQTVTTSYTIPSGQNSMTAGPISINSGVTVTIPSGSEWTIV